MANLQYIGARYVPKFYENSQDPSSTDWESGIGYEPLTVVTYNADTYTSRKPVPGTVGNPADNPIYWAKTGDFNAALVALQNAVNEIIENIDNDESLRDHKNIICIGDSYLAINQESTSWGAYLRGYLGTGYNVTLNGLGSSGFIGTAPQTFLQLLQDVNVADKDLISDIIVLGGMNDTDAISSGTYNENDLLDAIEAFLSYAHTNYPNAKVSIGFCGWQAYGFTGRDANVPWLIKGVGYYRDAIFRTDYANCAYLNDIEYIMPILPTSNYAADKIHPGNSASNAIAGAVYNYLKTGTALTLAPQIYNSLTITKDASINQIVTTYFKYHIDKETLFIDGGAMQLNYNTNPTLAINSNINVGVIENEPIRACSDRPVILSCEAAVFPGRNSNTFDRVKANLIVSNGAVTLKLYDSAGAPSFTNVTSVQLDIFSTAVNVLTAC